MGESTNNNEVCTNRHNPSIDDSIKNLALYAK